MAVALEAGDRAASRAIVWHARTSCRPADLVVLPGGFSYGDYLRCGAIAARSPIMADVVRARAARGVLVLGVCNGFQILLEAGLLPGVLMRNAALQVRLPRGAALRGRDTQTRPSPARYRPAR